MKHFEHVHFTFNVSEGSQISPITPKVTQEKLRDQLNHSLGLKADRNITSRSLTHPPSIFI